MRMPSLVHSTVLIIRVWLHSDLETPQFYLTGKSRAKCHLEGSQHLFLFSRHSYHKRLLSLRLGGIYVANRITHVIKRVKRRQSVIPACGSICDPNLASVYLRAIHHGDLVEPSRQEISGIFQGPGKILDDRYLELLALRRIKSEPKMVSDQILKSINANLFRRLRFIRLHLQGKWLPCTPNVDRWTRQRPCASCKQNPGS